MKVQIEKALESKICKIKYHQKELKGIEDVDVDSLLSIQKLFRINRSKKKQNTFGYYKNIFTMLKQY